MIWKNELKMIIKNSYSWKKANVPATKGGPNQKTNEQLV